MTLYELTETYRQLLELAEDEELDPEVLADTLEGLDGSYEDKADGYAKIIRTLDSQKKIMEDEIKRLKRKSETLSKNIDKLKGTLEMSMRATGKVKFKTVLFSFGIQKNPASLEITDDEAVPEEYRIPQPDKIDKAAAKAYIKEHGEQPWGKLVQTEGLKIR